MITFDGDVTYEITSPNTASEPSTNSAPSIARIADINNDDDAEFEIAPQTINLAYHYQDGEPVKNAPYTLTLADGTEIEGTLDDSGQAELENMPTGQFTVQYGEDTREYAPVDNTKPNPLYGKISPANAVALVEAGDTSLLDEAGSLAASAGDWLWGTLQGDFNENPSTSQIVVGSIISMIPVIDQIMDCRDVCANVMVLTDDDKANDTNGWIALTLTGIGFIPVLGSAVKGVGKVIVKNAEGAISLAAATLRKLGKGDPITYIKNIDWQDLGKQAAALIKEKVTAIRDALHSISDSWILRETLSDKALASIKQNADRLDEVLPKIDEGIASATNLIEAKANKAVKAYEGELPHRGRTGEVKKVKTNEVIGEKSNNLPGAQPRVYELEPGKKGGWNKVLNGKLEANATYKVGKYTYKTDELGRVKSVSGELDLSKADRNTYQQTKAGKTDGIKDGLAEDEGGHLIASIFKGPGEQINYAAMDGNLNKGAWKQMENDWAKALKGDPPKTVEVEISVIYENNSKRAKKFVVESIVDGIPDTFIFKNKPGG